MSGEGGGVNRETPRYQDAKAQDHDKVSQRVSKQGSFVMTNSY